MIKKGRTLNRPSSIKLHLENIIWLDMMYIMLNRILYFEVRSSLRCESR